MAISPTQQAANHSRRLQAHEQSLSNKRAALRELQSRLVNSENAAAKGDGVLGSERLQDELRTRIADLRREVEGLEAQCASLVADWRA